MSTGVENKMPKVRPGITMDSETWAKLKREVESPSQILEEMAEQYVDAQSTDKKQLIKKQQELVEEKQSLVEQRKSIDDEITQIDEQLKTVRTTLMELKQKEEKQEEIETVLQNNNFFEVAERKGWRSKDDIPEAWVKRTGYGLPEIWKELEKKL